MAHQIESMAYVGQTPWHGLGNALEPRQPLEVWLDQAGMNWTIEASPVCFQAGCSGSPGELREFSDKRVLYRSDTLAPLSVVGQRYQVVQPQEILEFYRDITEASGIELETAGVLKGGRKLWALARTGQSTTLKGKDETRAYVLLATACDGSMATTAQFTSIRVVFNNTLSVATSNTAGAIKVPHNTVFDPQRVKNQLGLSNTSWNDFMYRMKLLSERKVKAAEARHFISRVMTDPNQPGSSGNAGEQAMGKILALYNGKGRGATLTAANDTAYGLLNAVTEYVDHGRRSKSPDHRLDSAWFGQGASLKKRALNEALRFAA